MKKLVLPIATHTFSLLDQPYLLPKIAYCVSNTRRRRHTVSPSCGFHTNNRPIDATNARNLHQTAC